MRQAFIFILALASLGVWAQARPETYNYQRGLEAIQEKKYDEALDYFNKDIKENPKSGYSHSWMAMIYGYNEEYGMALNSANQAIKYLPNKDKEYVVFAYSTRAETYLHLADTVKAINDLNTMIKIEPEERDHYKLRAQIYVEHKKYKLADAGYDKMIELNPGDVVGYMGKGRNANAQKNWDEAIKQFDYITKLTNEYPSVYAFRAEAYLAKKMWNEATDDIISALSADWDVKALSMIEDMNESARNMLIAKMRVQAAKSPNDLRWTYIIGLIYEEAGKYEQAITAYIDANAIEPSPVTYKRLATCKERLGDYEGALSSINSALNMDSTNVEYMGYKANLYYELDKPQQAISEWDKVLKLQPEYAWGYYRRGWFKELTGNMDGAIDDLSMSIVLAPEYTYSYASRGDVYLKLGKRELAESDFHKIIELEKTPADYTCIHYAYQGLGKYEMAMVAMDSILASDPDDAGNYYDAACLYSRMGKADKALGYLEQSLELGYKRFAHIRRDSDLDLIRNTDAFKRLIAKYDKVQEAQTQVTYTTKPEKTSDVPFSKENGVYKVKCSINGLPLHFVFDTGASDVTLSLVEANFMMKNGYLSEKDVVGSQRFMDANGDVSVGTVINIREVSFGDLNLNNVRATVVRNQRAPLLLGQSVLGRLGKIEIDNAKRVLKISHP